MYKAALAVVLSLIVLVVVLLLLVPQPRVEMVNAVGSGDVVVVKRHLDRGYDVNSTADSLGDTLLHYALMGGVTSEKTEVARLLVDCGASIRARNDSGMTPLHTAAYWGNKEIVALLVARGADIDAHSNDGRSPLAIALQMHHTETAALLRKHGAR